MMRQIGHTDPDFTLRVYSHLMSREPGERERLKALVSGERVIAVPAPPEAGDLAEYEAPILRRLTSAAGRAARGRFERRRTEAMASATGRST